MKGRLILVSVVLALWSTGIVARLYQLQVVDHLAHHPHQVILRYQLLQSRRQHHLPLGVWLERHSLMAFSLHATH